MKIPTCKLLTLLWIILFSVNNSAQQFSLKIITSPNVAFGGETFEVPPSVSVVNSLGQIDVNYIGSAYVAMGSSPTGFESLFIGNSCDQAGFCGDKVTRSNSVIPFHRGVATFQNLLIKSAGTGYSLKIVGLDSKFVGFASVTTSQFDVRIGPVFRLSFVSFVGIALGGLSFNPNPSISIADRGGNKISEFNFGTVTAYISKSPTPNEPLLPSDKCVANIKDGLAVFQKLFINRAGYPYVLGFRANIEGYNLPDLFTREFYVSVGNPGLLRIVNGTNLSLLSNIFAGEFLFDSPEIELLDSGGNLISSDSSSRVDIKILDNPANAQLLPADNLFSIANKGKVVFSSFKIDRPSDGYRLSFHWSSYSFQTGEYKDTNIYVATERFTVSEGMPRRILTRQYANMAWAGGQPMEVQPQLTLVDYSGNVLKSDYSSYMTASLIPSPGSNTLIRIDTRAQTIKASIETVDVDVLGGTYGTGKNILFSLNFDYDISVAPFAKSGIYLKLNVLRLGQATVKAYLIGLTTQVSTLQFIYTVIPGDSIAALDYLDSDALTVPGGSRIYDANNFTADVRLPVKGIRDFKIVQIDTSAPFVTSFYSNTTSGEYGVGTVIAFYVEFNAPVVVAGIPILALTVLTANSSKLANAIYLATSADRQTLTFVYTVFVGDSSTHLLFRNESIILTSRSPTSIKLISESPVTDANVTFNQFLTKFEANTTIIIDTSVPILDPSFGIRTYHSNGIFYPGEEIFLLLKFSKPIINNGVGINLVLEGGHFRKSYPTYAEFSRILEDKMTIEFRYIVPTGVNTSRLDIMRGGRALSLPGFGTYIRRASTHPLMNANIDTNNLFSSGNSLRDTADISLSGATPKVVGISLFETNPPNSTKMFVDDYFIIGVTFNAPVFVTCTPVLVIDVGYEEDAIYVSGNLSKTLYFRYTVEFGDVSTTGLNYRFRPNALCSDVGCPFPTSCGIFANSTFPTLPVDLTLPLDDGSRTEGVPISKKYSVLGIQPIRNTTILSIKCRLVDGIYGPGTTIYYDVSFSDIVQIRSISSRKINYPRLYLNIGRYANYSSGENSRTLTFYYVSNLDDQVNQLTPIDIPGMSPSSALRCLTGEFCLLRNRIGRPVEISTSNVVDYSAEISLNGIAPKIVKVQTFMVESPYDGEYTVGESIILNVVFDRPVLVTGAPPRIPIDVIKQPSSTIRYAAFVPALSSSTTLIFRYIVEDGDFSINLNYDTQKLDRNGDKSKIYLRSEVPLLEVDYTLPQQLNLTMNSAIIRINAVTPTIVKRVVALSPSTRYTVGDTIFFRVDFSRYIICNGYAEINLNCGDHYGVGKFIGVNESHVSQSNIQLPSAPTKSLYFKYRVDFGDFNSDLDYIDTHSLFSGLNIVGGQGKIYEASRNPTKDAILYLPIPGTSDSLSASGDLYVDGYAPYMTSLIFDTKAGTYGLGDTIFLVMNFSQPVKIIGKPYIVLETGSIDRRAFYDSGSGSRHIFFKYYPQPGDFSGNLDYKANRANLLSAAESFNLNGGKVLALSSNPSIDAIISLNPPKGILQGTRVVTAISGTFSFINLGITKTGLDYRLNFFTSPLLAERIIPLFHTVFVSFSSEYEVRPREALRGFNIGSSVDIANDIAVIGSPKSNVSVTTIQTVTTSGATLAPQMEVQIITTTIDPQPFIQSFHSSAGVGEVIGGYFTISFETHGTTRFIPANVDKQMLSTLLQEDIPILGSLEISRQPYIFCACENAFMWLITFLDLKEGQYEALSFDGSALTGLNASIIGPKVLQSPSFLSGSFRLKFKQLTSSPIPYDASVDQMRKGIVELGLSAYEIQITPTEKSGCRSWMVTFDSYLDSYKIPLLSSDSGGLLGGTSFIWHKVLREGIHTPSGLAGKFALEWRGNTTRLLNFDASATDMKLALLELDVVGSVNVERSSPSSINGFTWTIEFVEVYANTPRGYLKQDQRNLEPMSAHNYLNGTDTKIRIGSIWDTMRPINIYGAERQGTFGADAGAAYVFQHIGDDWEQVATLIGNDTDENDRFGHSVALTESVIVIGAPAADMTGLPEKQGVFCSAESGSFRLLFRGWKSSPINFDTSRQALIDSIVSDLTYFSKLYTISSIQINDWGSGGLCKNNTAVITFLSPVDGAAHLNDGKDTFSDLELLGYENIDLESNSVIRIFEIQPGTRRVHGLQSDLQQLGSVYIFRASEYSCGFSVTFCRKKVWLQEAQFSPVNPVGGEEFGAAVAISGSIIVVGAPGTKNGSGKIYVYEYQKESWYLIQQIIDVGISKGEQFGFDVAIMDRTIVVGAPFANSGAGAIFIYKRPESGGLFASSQSITSSIQRPFRSGDMFGLSLALNDLNLVIGCPGADVPATYLGQKAARDAQVDAGAVYIFSRQSVFDDFFFSELLDGSNVRQGDQFGWDVDIDANLIVVGALEKYTGDLMPSRAVVEIKTQAIYNRVPVGGQFQIKWKTVLETDTLPIMRTTRAIKYDATAAEMKAILEADLATGDLIVSRSNIDVFDGGYQWLVTFLDDQDDVGLFTAHFPTLTGTNAFVNITYVFRNPPSVRGKAHVFRRETQHSRFKEQVFIAPYSFQRMDRCGSAVAISGLYSFIGCPNRDLIVPNQNSGSGFIFFLSLLNVKFAASLTTVVEGETAEVVVTKSEGAIVDDFLDILFYIQSVDRNADLRLQTYLAQLYGVKNTSISIPLTYIDYIGNGGTALARSQDYGSFRQESVWVDGMYDYRGISDYVPLRLPRAFLDETKNVTVHIVTTPDSIFEFPDETIKVAIHSPGIWPTTLGDLLTTVLIVDNGDGVVMESQYTKLYKSDDITDCSVGGIVRFNDDLKVLFTGLPDCLDDSGSRGLVLQYNLVSQKWIQTAKFSSPLPHLKGVSFGSEIVLTKHTGKSVSICAVSEPSVNKVHIFVSEGSNLGVTFVYDTSLSAIEVSLPQHKFGIRGTLALYENILVVGAPGLEAIFVYIRKFSNTRNNWEWGRGDLLRSSDFDFDIISSSPVFHQQEFGSAISVHGRTIAVGAPYADYDKLGSDLVEIDWNTQGESIQSFGRGKVYTFYSKPAVQILRLRANQQLKIGTFRVKYNNQGLSDVTAPMEFSTSPLIMKLALEALINVDSVSVIASTSTTSEGFQYTWTISFLSEWNNPPLLMPVWYIDGNASACFDCVPFDIDWTGSGDRMDARIISEVGNIFEHQSLKAYDGQSGDRFGLSVVLENDQLVVGAPYSASVTTTTWDYESGNLVGWSKTGTAFDFQPTYGDNSYRRIEYSEINNVKPLSMIGIGKSTRPGGLYYIGTFEKRPGSPDDFTVPDGKFPQGGSQGDAPTGTLSSDVFIIYGNSIKFYIGGGCDILTEYVELRVDGFTVAKETGHCQETMKQKRFDVSQYFGRAGQIRIVDESVSNWGHINVDDFVFDWDVHGLSVDNKNLKVSTGGKIETPRSGAVYTISRRSSNTVDLCHGDVFKCKWVFETKLTASDKRPGCLFGSSISLNDASGIIVVSSPKSSVSGFYGEEPSVYPYKDAGDNSTAAGLDYPLPLSQMEIFQGAPTSSFIATGASGVWLLGNKSRARSNSRIWDEGGTAYVFIKDHAVISGDGTVSVAQHWYSTEKFRLQAPDELGMDNFGESVFINGKTLAVGSPGQDGKRADDGAIYLFKMGIASVSFSQVEYHVLEGTDLVATITLQRNLDIDRDRLVVEYATSDLTAKGVDSDKFNDCLALSPARRANEGCGDYEQSRGIIIIGPNENSGGFQVRIMNDLCGEHFMKYIQITISVPGSSGLQGEAVMAKLRIDDDDFITSFC